MPLSGPVGAYAVLGLAYNWVGCDFSFQAPVFPYFFHLLGGLPFVGASPLLFRQPAPQREMGYRYLLGLVNSS